MAMWGRVRRNRGVFVNPERRARRKVCKQLGITNKRFRKLNKKYHFAKYDYLSQEYRRLSLPMTRLLEDVFPREVTDEG
ncbi:MAG: hypothetical protein J3T61_01340 [Candidatus Brocadiales bacterium]|nr:hypothetical protein [Candidatus Bathyanammoxibius sp.]